MSPVMWFKARQASKIAEIGEALRAAGMLTLPAQVKVLGLRRSTAYTLRDDHGSVPPIPVVAGEHCA